VPAEGLSTETEECRVDEAFQKGLSHLTWREVYARQVTRAGLVGEWIDALKLKPGARVLAAAAGPG